MFQRIKNLNQINPLYSIDYNPVNNLREGEYKYLNNLENLIFPMIY